MLVLLHCVNHYLLSLPKKQSGQKVRFVKAPRRFAHQPESLAPLTKNKNIKENKKGQNMWATWALKHKTSWTTIQAGVKQSGYRMVVPLNFSSSPHFTNYNYLLLMWKLGRCSYWTSGSWGICGFWWLIHQGQVRGVDYLCSTTGGLDHTIKASAPQNDSRKSHLTWAALHPPQGMLPYRLKSSFTPWHPAQLARSF